MLERDMSEGSPAPSSAIARISTSEISGGTPPPDFRAERAPTPERRTAQLLGFNALFKFYEEANRPLWERLEKGEELSEQERKSAVGYKITLDGIERLTQEPHRLGEAALPDTLAGDEFANTYVTPDGRTKKQREGLVTNHMTKWAQGEIDAGNTNAALRLSREIVWENSLPYPELHTTPGSISLEDRIRQEAGGFIHDTGEGPEGRNIHGVKVRDSQHPHGTEEHALEDWITAETELGEREEYIINPPLPTDALTFVNPPKIVFDPDAEPRDIHIPDRVENGPVNPGRVRSRRSDEQIKQWVVDLGGKEVSVGPVNVTNEYRVPAERATGSEVGEPVTVRDAGFSRDEERAPEGNGLRVLATGGAGGEPSADEAEESVSGSEDIARAGEPERRARGSLLNATSYPGDRRRPDTRFEGMTGSGAVDTVRELDGSRARESRSGPSDGVPPRVAPGFANEPGVRRGSYGELLPPEEIKLATEGSDRGVVPEVKGRIKEGIGGESNEDEAKIKADAERGERILKTSLGKRIWDRTRSFIADKIPEVDLPKMPRIEAPKGNRFLRNVVLAALAGAVLAQCIGPKGGQIPGVPSGAEPLPGGRYGPNIGRIVDRPQVTSVLPAEERAINIDPNQNQVFRPATAENKRAMGYSTWSEDFTGFTEGQNVTGLTQDHLAQTLSPEYAKLVRTQRIAGSVVDAKLGLSESILNKFRNDLIGEYGEAQGTAIARQFEASLVAKNESVINERNLGVARVEPDGSIKFEGRPFDFKMLDIRSHGGQELADSVRRVTGQSVDSRLPQIHIEIPGN